MRARLQFGAEFGELVFVVGPAVDGGGGFLIEEADLGFEVGNLSLRVEQGGLCFFEGWQIQAISALRTAGGGSRRGRQGSCACDGHGCSCCHDSSDIRMLWYS